MIYRIFKFIRNFFYQIKAQRFWIRKKIFSHVTYCTVGNVGDNVLSYYTRLIINNSSNSSWNIIPVDQKVNKYVLNKINRTSLLIIGGGGLFLPDTNKNDISGWQWAISCRQLDHINIPIIIFAVGYNFFRGQKNSEIFIESLNKLVSRSNFFSLRNHGSIRAVREIVTAEYHDKICYQPCITTIIRKITTTLPIKTRTNNIAFNMAFDRSDRRYGDKKTNILIQVAKAASEIEKRGYSINYIAHCKADMEFVQYLKNYCLDITVFDTDGWLPKKLLNIYNTMDMVIGMRGHAQMIPFGLNCEIMSLGTHDKMKWFLEDIEALDWYIDLLNTNGLEQKIINTFIRIHEQDNINTQQRLILQQEKLYQITLENMSKIIKL